MKYKTKLFKLYLLLFKICCTIAFMSEYFSNVFDIKCLNSQTVSVLLATVCQQNFNDTSAEKTFLK